MEHLRERRHQQCEMVHHQRHIQTATLVSCVQMEHILSKYSQAVSISQISKNVKMTEQGV